MNTFSAKKIFAFVTVVATLVLSGCAQDFTPITKQQAVESNAKGHTSQLSACEIFQREPEWYPALAQMEENWGTPIHVAMAFVKQESSFVHNARPIKKNAAGKKIGYASSAYGYAQALDGTWSDFVKVTNRKVDRTDFADATQFIGWYTSLSKAELKLSWRKIAEHYLAYHEGRGGYARGRHEGKTALLNIAEKVENQAKIYKSQLKSCEGQLKRNNRFSNFAKK